MLSALRSVHSWQPIKSISYVIGLPANVRYWHKADVVVLPINVPFWGKAVIARTCLPCPLAACWPGPPLVGMLIYSTVVTLYLYLGFAGGLTGGFCGPRLHFT